MAIVQFDQLKVALYPGEMQGGTSQIHQDQCYAVQHFNYLCSRSRDKYGVPYGPTASVIMDFSVRLVQSGDGRIFYENMQSNSSLPFTFIFNASFNGFKQLEDYYDLMVVHGHVVDIEEVYEDIVAGASQQVNIIVKLLLSDIKYVGEHSDVTLRISDY